MNEKKLSIVDILKKGKPLDKSSIEFQRELREEWDNRFIDIETIIGLNHQSEVANIIPFKGRLEKLEQKFEVLDHFDKLKVFNEKLERIETILTRLIEIEFENYHVSPYDDDILQKLYKQIKETQNGKVFDLDEEVEKL